MDPKELVATEAVLPPISRLRAVTRAVAAAVAGAAALDLLATSRPIGGPCPAQLTSIGQSLLRKQQELHEEEERGGGRAWLMGLLVRASWLCGPDDSVT